MNVGSIITSAIKTKWKVVKTYILVKTESIT